MNKIYVAGKISGIPLEEAIKKFSDYESEINCGYKIVNPLSLHECYGCPECETLENTIYLFKERCGGTKIKKRLYEEYIKMDLIALLECNEVHFLPCWKDSKGAKVEHEVAKILNMKIVYVNHPNG